MPRTMSRIATIFAASAAAICFAPQLSAQSVTLDPGLYDYSHVVSMGGRALPADTYEYCVREGRNSRTLDELVASLAGDGECTVSNVNMTGSTGRADLTCTDTDLGMDISGTLEAEYGSDFYDVISRAKMGPLPVRVDTKVRRRGDCPANWNNPDNVSDDW